LLLVKLDVTFLQLTHLFDLVKINHKTLIHVVKFADALSTEDRGMFRAIKMLDSLVVSLTHIRLNLFVLA
jgi:hypothetical protein